MKKNQNSNRVVKGVKKFHHARGFYSAGFAVWQNGKICQGPWSKEEALEILSHGGEVFSGHRNCPGMQGNRFLVRALEAWAGNWYSQVDKVYGPSSWTIKISVRDGRVYANGLQIRSTTPGPQKTYLPEDCYMAD
ncbi:MAG: hypothetical protein J6Y53_04700 [Alphaproteobacteria bacterium]|nr:hypothetical protein [Alphaproteobacteria bacterium]